MDFQIRKLMKLLNLSHMHYLAAKFQVWSPKWSLYFQNCRLLPLYVVCITKQKAFVFTKKSIISGHVFITIYNQKVLFLQLKTQHPSGSVYGILFLQQLHFLSHPRVYKHFKRCNTTSGTGGFKQITINRHSVW